MPAGITQTYNFSSDHTFMIVTASSKNLRHFGDWIMDRDQLTIIRIPFRQLV